MKLPYYRPAASLASGLICIWTVTSAIWSMPVHAQNREFLVWLEGVKAEARQIGISENIIKSALTGVQPVARIIKRDRNQSEFKLTLSIYKKRVVTPKNVQRGKRKAQQHLELLKRISKKYGVQSRFILAIWGIETRFGAVKANVPLIPSIATLAYDRRRSKYFRKQLISVLQMLDRGYIEQNNLLGSWAGAMGQPQFMPSSYLAYAQDFDGDGRRDIWKNTGDVLASIANYLAEHGWRPGITWGREVTVPSHLIKILGKFSRRAAPGCRAKTSERKPLTEWQKLGVRRIDNSDLPLNDLYAALVIPDGTNGKKTYLVYRNYASIMSYNCAHLYAVTVGILSDRIGKMP